MKKQPSSAVTPPVVTGSMSVQENAETRAKPAQQSPQPAGKRAPQQPVASAIVANRAKNLALAGLFLSMAVSMLAMSVVGTSMPVIIHDIGGDQAAFVWVMTATMLASAVSTPIWGKLADLTSKKLLLQLSLVIFTAGSMLAGLATDPTWLISARVIQGLGAGGLGALGQIVLAEIISPRERGKYMGIMSAIMAVSTVGGPLLGGFITDASDWRWNFYVAVPIAIAAIVLLQRTLHLSTEKRPVTIDYLGATFITFGFSSLLVWITLAGSQFEWLSLETLIMAGGGALMLVIAVFVELRAEEPILPMELFKNRTFTLSSIASISVGLVMFGTAVFLGQYMQIAKGYSPFLSGLLTIPMMAGMLVSSTAVGQIITRTGFWKRYTVAGSLLLTLGLVMMGQLRHDTNLWYVGVAMFVLGVGVGMSMQNLVLVVQNTTAPEQVGVATSGVTFFRTIGGTAGMSAMGALLSQRILDYLSGPMTQLLAQMEQNPDPVILADIAKLQTGTLPQPSELSDPVRVIVESAYGHGIGDIFLFAAPLALIAIVAIVLLPNTPLGLLSNAERRAQNGVEEAEAL